MTTEMLEGSVYASRPWVAHYDPGVRQHLDYPDNTLPQFLVAHAEREPERTAIIFYDRRINYRELARLSRKFANALIERGVQPGDRVALLMPNCPQFVFSYYGALMAGAIIVPSNPLYVENEIEHQLNDSGATVLVTLSKFFPTVQAVRERTPLKRVIVTNIKEYFPAHLRYLFTLLKERKEGHRVEIPQTEGTAEMKAVLAGASDAPPAVATSPDDVAVLQYTGGTTGVAKGAILSHRNLIADLVMIREWLKDARPAGRDYDIAMGVLPFFHTYGMSTVMNTIILDGGTMILAPRFEHKPVLEAVHKYGPNLFPGVPTMYSALNHYPGIEKYNLRSVAVCISGGAPLPVEVKRRFEQLTGAAVAEGYGLSEASPVTHCNPLRGENRAGSIGLPFPDTDVKIVDPTDGVTLMPAGEIGELAIKGPQIMRGYWNRERESGDVLRDGWLYTGDLARMDADGYFSVVDRKKDMIITGGFNVFPRDIEEPLYRHPKVREAVAVGVPDEYWGEKIKLYLVLKEGETSTADEIIAYCHEQMAGYKVPKEVEFRDSLPTSMIGKFLRRVLREEEIAKQQQQSAKSS